jgi:putative acetyltransferase
MDPPVTMRAYVAADAEPLAAIFYASVREAGRRDYSAEQVAAWAPAPPSLERVRARAGDGRVLLVAVNTRGEPVAYGDLEADGHIDHLFCRPDVVGTGVASRLYDELEAVARRQGLRRLYVEASEAARRLFLRKGFSIVRRRDFAIHGVAIHNYAMAKALFQQPEEPPRASRLPPGPGSA